MQGALWVPRAAHLLKLDAPHIVEAEVRCLAGFPAWLYDSGTVGMTWPVSIILQEVKNYT